MKQIEQAVLTEVSGASVTGIVSTTIGSGLGGIAGTFAGGPVGSVVGAGVGAGVGAEAAQYIDDGINKLSDAVVQSPDIQSAMMGVNYLAKWLFGFK